MTDKALFHRPERIVIPVPHYVLDDTLETVQGKSNTVRQLYEDYVLGKLDPAQLAGGGVYDAEDATSVDPMNHFGITLEETTSPYIT